MGTTDIAAIAPRTNGRSRLNFWIDLVTAILFAALLGSGALMKWILPPGTCDDAGLKLWLGHARHWWGDIHFWIAISMLALLLVHIWLHWGWICALWARLIGRGISAQSAAVMLFMAGLISVPWILPAQVVDVPAAASNGGIETAPASAGAAPCGIEGLSCETCPAADDRLFGGSCQEPAKAVEQPAGDKCAECPSAGSCSSTGGSSETAGSTEV